MNTSSQKNIFKFKQERKFVGRAGGRKKSKFRKLQHLSHRNWRKRQILSSASCSCTRTLLAERFETGLSLVGKYTGHLFHDRGVHVRLGFPPLNCVGFRMHRNTRLEVERLSAGAVSKSRFLLIKEQHGNIPTSRISRELSTARFMVDKNVNIRAMVLEQTKKATGFVYECLKYRLFWRSYAHIVGYDLSRQIFSLRLKLKAKTLAKQRWSLLLHDCLLKMFFSSVKQVKTIPRFDYEIRY